MSTTERPVYVRPVFNPTSPVNPTCPLCWDNGMLKGGEVLAEGSIFYVYVFLNEDDTLKECFIAAKQHHPDMTTLPPLWGEEFGQFFAALRRMFDIQEYNGYWNEGRAAGQTIFGHWHVKFDRAPAWGTPAFGMGLALLRREFNELSKLVA